MSNFDLSALALKAVCPNNEILYDDKGMPSIMVKIPKMTYAQLGLGSNNSVHPAFIVNGTEVDAIYISKYQNIVQNGRAYSLPGQDPSTSITFDAALEACTAKGAGWHLMTRAEWAMLALWCKMNGSMPNGNNNYGMDSTESNYKAIPMILGSDGRINRVATGTGPLSWSHDGTPGGIWDLNGNVSEWCGGLRLVYGELQILANNNAADMDNPQSAASSLWKAIKGSDGSLITPDGNGRTSGSVKLSWDGSKWKYTTNTPAADTTYHGCAFENVVCDSTIGDAAKLLLQALAMFRYDTTSDAYGGDYLYFNVTEAERSLCCGGGWGGGAFAGVFYSNLNDGRNISGGGIGFRSAFVQLPTA
jgi:hypothetical protein